MRITAVPKSSRSAWISSSTCACTVTSSAVVGSSAMRMSGRSASAIAIIARCRIPPDISCGKLSNRSSGLGMPTERSASIVRRRARSRDTSSCVRIASTI